MSGKGRFQLDDEMEQGFENWEDQAKKGGEADLGHEKN